MSTMSMTRRLVVSGLALSAAVVGLGSTIGSTASAGSNLCASNRVCIYDHNHWVALLGARAPGGGLVNVSAGANDKMSSWENKTGTNAAWYEHSNGGGFCRNMPARSEVGDHGSTNDKLSSWRTNRGC